MLLPARLAVTDQSLLTRGRSVSSAEAASIERRRKTSVTNWLRLAARPTALGCPAALSAGWMQSDPPGAGNATRTLAGRWRTEERWVGEEGGSTCEYGGGQR